MEKQIDHSARAHALLSPSGASKWINCPPSPRLEEQFENISSPYAEEGTLAHEFAEMNLKLQLKLVTKREYNKIVKPLKANEWYSEEMEEEVQKHVDYVKAQYIEANRKTEGGAILIIEDRIDLTHLIEGGFGANDVAIIADGTMEVIDFKYGKGVRVSSEENPQLKLYGLGALRSHEFLYDIDNVRLTVTQPRMDNISVWEITTPDLKIWGEEVVKPVAEVAYLGNGDQKVGDWCRFCRAKPKCRAMADESLRIAKLEFAEPKLLSDEELVEVYMKSSLVQNWIKGVSEYLLKEALKGKKWPEHKLVAGRSNRIWSDKDEAIAVLKNEGFQKEDYMSKPNLLGIGAIEKLVKKPNFFKLLGMAVDKPKGKPTLVHESDKRPEFSDGDAKDDFGGNQDALL